MLTSVLREALGGNCRTVLVATLNPEPQYAEESVSTCRFAARCATLQTRVSVHQIRDPAVTIALLRERNRTLAARVAALEQAGRVAAAAAPASHEPHTDGAASGIVTAPAASTRVALLSAAQLAELERRIAAYLRHVASLPSPPSLHSTPASGGVGGGEEEHGASIEVGLADGLPRPTATAAGEGPAAAAAPSAVAATQSAAWPESVRGLVDITAHLRLTDLASSYATCHLLFTALARAVTVAGEATSAVDFERARLQGAMAGLASATAQVQRLTREVGEWESRHAALCSEHEHVLTRCQQLQRDSEALKAAADARLAGAYRGDEGAASPRRDVSGADGGDASAPASLAPSPSTPPGADHGAMAASPQGDERSGLDMLRARPGEMDGDAMSTTMAFTVLDGESVDTRARVELGHNSSAGPRAVAPPQPRRHLSVTSATSRASAAGGYGGSGAEAGASRASTDMLATLSADVSRLMAAKAARDLVVSGSVFVKHGRRGRPHIRFVWVDADGLGVHWRPVGKDRSSGAASTRESMLLTSCIDVVPGRRTAVFARSPSSRDDACWSIIAYDRTLDLEVHWPQAGEEAAGGGGAAAAAVTAMERQLRDKWVAAFKLMLAAAHAGVPRAPPAGVTDVTAGGHVGVGGVPPLVAPATVVSVVAGGFNTNLAASMVSPGERDRPVGDADDFGLPRAPSGVLDDDLDSASVAESLLPPAGGVTVDAGGTGVAQHRGGALRVVPMGSDGAADPMLAALVAVLERQARSAAVKAAGSGL
jgi:hypothetical protein